MEYAKDSVEAIRKIFKEKGEEWLIGALIDGSIGYYSVFSARRLIISVLAGRYVMYERTSANFDGDAAKEILRDAGVFARLEETNPEKVKRVLEFVKATEKLDPIQQMTVGLMYPTMNI